MILEINSMKGIKDFINSNLNTDNQNKSIVFFDIDDTILIQDHPACYYSNIKKYYDDIKQIHEEYHNVDSTVAFCNTLFYDSLVFDEGFYDIMNNVKCPKLACTALISGDYYCLRPIEEFRYQVLRSKNIIFEDQIPSLPQRIVFDSLPQYLGSYPVYHKGILVSNSECGPNNKGTVIESFLNYNNLCPEQIFMIDDKMNNLLNISAVLDHRSCNFFGIHFNGAMNYLAPDISQRDFINFWKHCYQRASDDFRNKLY